MAVVSVTNTFTSLTPAVASEVNRNFTDVVEFVNGDTVHRDGSRPFTGEVSMGSHKITNVSSGVSANDAVNVAQLGGALPAGFIGMYGSDVPPSAAWLACDGAAYSRAAYPDLFAAIGVSYGSGDGATTFNVPNLNSRFPFGASAGQTGGSNDAVAVSHSHTVGSHSHTMGSHSHTIGSHSHSMPSHTHTMNKHSHDVDDHKHTMGTHSHSINHNHGAADTTATSHTHSTSETTINSGLAVVYQGGGGTLGLADGNVWGGVWGNPLNVGSLNGSSTGGSHKHSFDMPNFTGTSGPKDPGDTNDKTGLETDSVNPGDTNSTDPGNTNGTNLGSSGSASLGNSGSADLGSTGSSGVAGTGLNRPAFVGVNFIIKSGL